MNNKIVKLALILFAVSAAVALCLGLVNGITAERIEAIGKEKLAAAMNAVLPADDYQPVDYTGGDVLVDSIYKADDKGYVVQCTVSGSQGSITMLTGVAADGTVTGISVLESGETPGLGAIAASSSERSPSFLATLDNSIIFVIISGTLTLTVLNTKVKLLSPPMKSDMLTDAIVAQKAPPKVIRADDGLIKKPIAAKPSSPDTIPNIKSIKHATRPIKDAISTFTHPFIDFFAKPPFAVQRFCSLLTLLSYFKVT